MDGYGTMTYADRSVYEGEWRDGKKHGRGTMTYADGHECEGEWRDDKVVEHAMPRSDEGEQSGKMDSGAELNCGRLVYSECVYEGELIDKKRHGYGKMTYSNCIYEGEWRNDKPHGYAKVTFSDGEIYEGNYFARERCGHGKTHYPDGGLYIGDWKYGKRYGRGVMVYPDKGRYEGEWKCGKRNGHGKMTYADGHVYEGKWKDDNPDHDPQSRVMTAFPMPFCVGAATIDLIARMEASVLGKTMEVVATSNKIDVTDKKFAETLESEIESSEIAALNEKKPVSERTKSAMAGAAERAKLENETNRAQLIEESETLIRLCKIAPKSLGAQAIGLSVGSQLNEYDERIAFYAGLLSALLPQAGPTVDDRLSRSLLSSAPSEKSRSASPPRADTAIHRAETAAKTAASEFAQRNREARSQELTGAASSGVGALEYVGRIAASVVVDDALPAVGRGIQALNEWTGGKLLSALHYVDPKTWGTGVRRGLRDGLGFPQEFAQNAGDAAQYIGEVGLLLCTFGSSHSSKIAKGAEIAADTAKGAESVAITVEAAKAVGASAAVAEMSSTASTRIAKFDINVVEWIGEKIHLKPYKGPGGGHHIDMKSAFISNQLYDFRKALCLTNEDMVKLGIDHAKASATQRRFCEDMIRSGKSMTREALTEISVEALVEAGADRQLARILAARSRWDLKGRGIRGPSNMPWVRKE